MARGVRWLLIAMAGVLVLELVVIINGSLGRLDADEATVGLMARHILDGEYPTFYWGQPFGGSGEAYLTAAGFWAVGSSIATLKIVPFMLQVSGAVVFWRVARRFVDENPAIIAGALMLIYSAYFVVRSTRSHGFYGLLLLTGMLTLLFTLRLEEKPESGPEAAALGFIVGLGWWTTPQIGLIAVPCAVWLVVRRPAVLRLWWAAIPAFVVGAFPWLHWNLANDWGSLAFELPRPENTYVSHLPVFFRQVLPMALGLRVAGIETWVLGPVGVGIYVGLLAVFALSLRDFVRKHLLLVLIALGYPLIYALSPWAWYGAEPRYLVLLHPILILLAFIGLVRFRDQVIAVGTAAALTVGTLVYMHHVEEGPIVGDTPTQMALLPLVRELERQGIDRVWADYWIAYPITFASEERVIAASTGLHRYQPFQDVVAAAPDASHVFPIGSTLERDFLSEIGDAASDYAITEVGSVVIYRPPG
jgi:4-amino-4-deoxy-L-arabinose transferase-like glycosyltransferase